MPDAVTVKVAVCPAVIVILVGCDVIDGMVGFEPFPEPTEPVNPAQPARPRQSAAQSEIVVATRAVRFTDRPPDQISGETGIQPRLQGRTSTVAAKPSATVVLGLRLA